LSRHGVAAGTWNEQAAIVFNNRHRLLGTLGGRSSQAVDINDAMLVVGESDLPDDPARAHAFSWQNGVMTDLGTLSGPGGYSRAESVNRLGQIVGFSWVGNAIHGFLYEGGVMTDLGAPPGAVSPNVVAIAINDLSHIAGEAHFSPDGDSNCFFYAGGAWKDIGNLGGATSECHAQAMNGHDEIVGTSSVHTRNGYDRAHAFVWRNGAMVDLGLPPGAYPDGDSVANDINDAGQVVGISDTTLHGDRVAILHDGQQMIDLNTRLSPSSAGWYVFQATAIDDKGEIAAQGRLDGVWHTLVLIPVP
jgi:probable HAF family extracellular repeat protein